jgi:hypothetical protein
MVKCKADGGDPASVLKDKIEKLGIKQGAD